MFFNAKITQENNSSSETAITIEAPSLSNACKKIQEGYGEVTILSITESEKPFDADELSQELLTLELPKVNEDYDDYNEIDEIGDKAKTKEDAVKDLQWHLKRGDVGIADKLGDVFVAKGLLTDKERDAIIKVFHSEQEITNHAKTLKRDSKPNFSRKVKEALCICNECASTFRSDKAICPTCKKAGDKLIKETSEEDKCPNCGYKGEMREIEATDDDGNVGVFPKCPKCKQRSSDVALCWKDIKECEECSDEQDMFDSEKEKHPSFTDEQIWQLVQDNLDNQRDDDKHKRFESKINEDVKVGTKFKHAGAEYEIIKIDDKSIICKRIDFGTGKGKEVVFDLDSLKNIIGNQTKYESKLTERLSELIHEVPAFDEKDKEALTLYFKNHPKDDITPGRSFLIRHIHRRNKAGKGSFFIGKGTISQEEQKSGRADNGTLAALYLTNIILPKAKAEYLGVENEVEESKVNEDDTNGAPDSGKRQIVARGITDKAEADKLAQSKKGKVVTDEANPKLFAVEIPIEESEINEDDKYAQLDNFKKSQQKVIQELVAVQKKIDAIEKKLEPLKAQKKEITPQVLEILTQAGQAGVRVDKILAYVQAGQYKDPTYKQVLEQAQKLMTKDFVNKLQTLADGLKDWQEAQLKVRTESAVGDTAITRAKSLFAELNDGLDEITKLLAVKESINEDLRTDVMDKMFDLGYSISEEAETDGIRHIVFKKGDSEIKVELVNKEKESEQGK